MIIQQQGVVMKTLLSVAVALGLSMSACARAGSLVDLKIVDRDSGAVLTPHVSEGKYFVAGIPGHRYGVQMRNRTGARVLAVVSVDGVNVVSGATASLDQDGYVLDPYQFTEIDGWRKSMSEVADFNFTALSRSYAAKTGRPDNVGVIGVAVFREKTPEWRERTDKIAAQPSYAEPQRERAQSPASVPPPAARDSAAAGAAKSQVDTRSANSAMAKPMQSESLGTGHGQREESIISYTRFERESSTPNEIDSVWYDSYNNLIARGIIDVPHREPTPFPNSFVPDPAG
jgi:hypothetical protein